MSKPSFSNIDLWLFELSEGNLTPEQVEQLELFLMQHPDLDVDRDVWEMARVEKTPVDYPAMDQLEKDKKPAGLFFAIGGTLALLLILFLSGYTQWVVQDELEEKVLALQEQREDMDVTLLSEIKELRNGKAKKGQLIDGAAWNFTYTLKAPVISILERNGNVGNSEPSALISQNTLYGQQERLLNYTVQRNNGEAVGNGNSRGHGAIDAENVFVIGNETSTSAHLVAEIDDVYEWQRWDGSNDVEHTGFKVDVDDAAKVTPRPPRHISSFSYSGGSGSFGHSNRNYGSSFTSQDHKRTLKSRMKNWGRMLQRMMDNPISLKNTRDQHYHLPGMTANDVNFSNAGTMLATRVQTLSRIQWLGKENEQMMNQLAVDGYSYNLRGGWGIQLDHTMYNKGGIHVGQVAFTYSPKLSISNVISLEPSVRFKMGNKQLDVNRMSDVEQVELDRGNTLSYYGEGQTPIGRSLWYKDLGLGMLVNTRWFYAGFQADNLFRYRDNIYSHDLENPRRISHSFVATIGTDWESKREHLGLSPYLVYQNRERLSELWAGVTFRWEWFTLGVAASNKLDPAASIGMKFKHFSMNYNADYTYSSMTKERGLSHQLSLRFVSKPDRLGKRHLKL